MLLRITDAQLIEINRINETQPDQLIAISDGTLFLVQDVRNDPHWEPWHDVLATATPYRKPMRTVDFMRLFTQAERIDIRSSTDPIIIDFRDLISVTPTVDLDDPDTINGIQYLARGNIIDSERAAEILSTNVPDDNFPFSP